MSEVKPTPRFVIRPGSPSDSGFISQHWVDGFKNAMPAPWVAHMEDGVFKRFCHHSIEGILKRAEVRIASPPGDDFTAYGYAVLEPGIIHFVFVRPSWRKMGIAKRLLEGVDVSTSTITTWSPDVSGFSGWIRNKYKSFRYVPFYMREGDEERKRKVEARHG